LRIGVVTGLAVEARCLTAARAFTPLVCCTGSQGVGHAAIELAAAGVAGLISFGLAGGLDPKLVPGSLVLAEEVVLPEGTRLGTELNWWQRCATALSDMTIHRGAILGYSKPVTGIAQKRYLFKCTGAAAVDMESHAVAIAAQQFGLPLLVTRVVADPADRAIPSLALVGVGKNGEFRPGMVILRLCQQPWALYGLLRLAADSLAALRALRQVAELLPSPL
jgi:hopanoid-associated phosphorylase